jgi:hypothetical protein
VVPILPDATGSFDGSNAAGVRGGWWAAADLYGADGAPGGGSCPMAGFAPNDCSSFTMPIPGQPFVPSANGQMCTSGAAAEVLSGADGAPAWSAIWGNIVGFNLAVDDAGLPGPYDPIARGFTGFAFDIDNPPFGGGSLRIEFATVGTENNAAYWGGTVMDVSPVGGPGHYEIRWGDIGGPMYLGPGAPPFDPTRLTAIRFHVVPHLIGGVTFKFCIAATVFLRD